MKFLLVFDKPIKFAKQDTYETSITLLNDDNCEPMTVEQLFQMEFFPNEFSAYEIYDFFFR
jgi:hypothetical protein